MHLICQIAINRSSATRGLNRDGNESVAPYILGSHHLKTSWQRSDLDKSDGLSTVSRTRASFNLLSAVRIQRKVVSSELETFLLLITNVMVAT